ncbi:hypothetical protein ACF0H5_007468 [Mactra antiquata]
MEIYIICLVGFVIYIPIAVSCVFLKNKNKRSSKVHVRDSVDDKILPDISKRHRTTQDNDGDSRNMSVFETSRPPTTVRSQFSVSADDVFKSRRPSKPLSLLSPSRRDSNVFSLVSVSVEDVTKSYTKFRYTSQKLSESSNSSRSNSLVSVTMDDQTKPLVKLRGAGRKNPDGEDDENIQEDVLLPAPNFECLNTLTNTSTLDDEVFGVSTRMNGTETMSMFAVSETSTLQSI